MLNVYHRELSSQYLGPYHRYVLWLQGCDKNCKGCMSQNSRKLDIYNYRSVEEIYEEIKHVEGIEGITVSGGDPMLQIKELTQLLKKVQDYGLGVIVYTGYTLEQVKELDGGNEILKYIDILIDGPYIEELNDNVSLRGSSNQRVILLSDRYRNELSIYGGKRKCLLKMTNHFMQMEGVPSRDALNIYYQIKNHVRGDDQS